MPDTRPDMDPDILSELRRRADTSRPIWETTPAEARRSRCARASAPRANAVGWRDLSIDCTDRTLPIRVYDAGREDDLVIVFFHGGGFVTGGLDTHHDQAEALAMATGRSVVSVGYRLAPEHPFPAAADDAAAAAEWARSPRGSAELGGAHARVAVAGVSAGANLAANLSREFARRGEPLEAQLLAYPWLDATEDFRSRSEFVDGPGLSTRALRWYADHYLPDPQSRRAPGFSPLRDSHPELLPPTVLAVAMLDPLRDDGLAYAELLAQAGVPASVQLCERLPHGFWGMTSLSPAAAAASQELCTRFTTLLDDLSTGT